MSDKIDEPLICDVMLPPATIIKRGCELRTLLAAINQRGKLPPAQRVFRDVALAQQPAPVSVPEAMDESHSGSSWEASYRSGWNACRAAMLAASPVAVPECPPGHELVAIPTDRIDRPYEPCGSIELAVKMLDIGLSFAMCNVDHAGTRRDVKKAQRYVDEIKHLLGAEQPDTVKVRRELLESLRIAVHRYNNVPSYMAARLADEEKAVIEAAATLLVGGRGMSDVKRYDCNGMECAADYSHMRFVLAADYDALRQRCRELDNLADQWAETNCALRAENVRLAEWYSEAGVREDTLRADNDRLRRALERIASRAEAFVSACAGMSEDSTLVIAGIARSAIEETPCAPTTGDTPAA